MEVCSVSMQPQLQEQVEEVDTLMHSHHRTVEQIVRFLVPENMADLAELDRITSRGARGRWRAQLSSLEGDVHDTGAAAHHARREHGGSRLHGARR